MDRYVVRETLVVPYEWPVTDLYLQAEEIASRIHPAWHKCGKGARKMHTRNVFQVLGDLFRINLLTVYIYACNMFLS